MTETTYLPTGCIEVDPEFGNIRGIVDTSLVPSVKEHGILEPLLVRPSGIDGIFYLVCGGRRFAAATSLKLDEVPVRIQPIADREVNTYQLLDVTRSELPIVVVRYGQIIGGQVVGVCRQVHGYTTESGEVVPGEDRMKVAITINQPADIVGAMVALCEEPIELVERVANGDLAISVYSRMKGQPWELKAKIIEKGGQITMDYVRNMITKWNAGKLSVELDDDGNGLIDQYEDEPAPSAADRYVSDEGDKTASPILQRVKGELKKLLDGGYDIEPTDLHILEEICELADELSR